MNRSDRRTNGSKIKIATYNMTKEQIDSMIEKAKNETVHIAVEMTTAAFIKALHDEFGFGIVRAERLINKVNTTIEDVNDGKLSLNGIVKWCKDYGVNIKGKS